jgi:hypothetical protein
MVGDSRIDGDCVLIFIWFEILNEIFRQVKELSFFHQSRNRADVTDGHIIEVEFEFHALPNKSS